MEKHINDRLDRLLREDDVTQYLGELERSAVFSALENHLKSSKEFFDDIMKFGSDADKSQLIDILRDYNIPWT